MYRFGIFVGAKVLIEPFHSIEVRHPRFYHHGTIKSFVNYPALKGEACDLPNGTYAWANFYTMFTSENLKIYPRRYLGALHLRDNAVMRLWLVTLHTRHRTAIASV